MNDEEISFEYNALIDNIQEKMALQYIPDRSPRQPNTYDRTRRNKDRFEFVQSRRGLHSLPRVQRSQGQQSQVHYQSQVDLSTFDFIDHEVDDFEGVPPSQSEGDYLLPSLPIAKKSRKDNGAQLPQKAVVETVELSQVRNKSRSGQEIQESWRNIDL
ncbi:hypothetical protein GMDG_08728 [Pseudogymnoascus destructans 20631-21]|uniref:Uncharacterized protein n=1 Tax=Pseudogymnoascus destructans (strain ATCC MYA-4855 / 20631-21) TaxID=658429 RepID=L8GAX0_PSED2|nr:hypothetical protein GMDG_08728 [Pseudogymnoascus destructans 20631-21]